MALRPLGRHPRLSCLAQRCHHRRERWVGPQPDLAARTAGSRLPFGRRVLAIVPELACAVVGTSLGSVRSGNGKSSLMANVNFVHNILAGKTLWPAIHLWC